MVFAYPSVPAFRFDRGGFTRILSRMPLLLLLIYAFWGWLLWHNRRNRAAFTVLGVLAAVYALLAHSGGDKIVALASGHGTEVLVATLFMYRAWSGSAILVPAERPVYAAVGLTMAWERFSFAFLAIVDPVAREAYLNRPDAENDFDRLNQLLGVPLDLFMLGILVGALLVPVVSFLVFRYRPWWRRVLARNA
jgi:hypothetical protein